MNPFHIATIAAICLIGGAAAQTPVKPTVSGKFTGNGKPAAIKFITVEEHEQFSGKDAITLIFTERDPAASKKPSFDALFGKLGSALTLNVHYDGGIFGCQVSHAAHTKSGFSSIGQIKMIEFEIAGGNVTGHVSTGAVLDTFGEKWEVDLKFAAPLPAKLRAASTSPAKPAATQPTSTPLEPPAKPSKAASAPGPSALKLPLPRDAKDVQFKALVNQIHFASTQPVDAVASELSARLKEQGWKDGVGGVKGPKNTILKREQGDAKLTIIIQQAPTGSLVKIFTEGLDWSGTESTPNTRPPAPGKSADAEAEDIEKQADKLLKDALKNLPKGF
jgi:hypothetical protein